MTGLPKLHEVTSGNPLFVREVLREWADLRASSGNHRGAYELTREALSVN